MPKQTAPLFALRASGKIGGHRRGRRRSALANPTSTFTFLADTYLNGFDPSVNYGASDFVTLGITYIGEAKTNWNRPLFLIDLTPLFGATILSAHLVLHVTGALNSDVDCVAARCTRWVWWREYEATWDDYQTGQPWTDPGGDFSDTDPPAITFTGPALGGLQVFAGFGPLVQDALDLRGGALSLLLRLADEAPGLSRRWSWYSRSGPGVAPTLVVEYAP